MSVTTPVADHTASFCRRAGATPTPRVVPAPPGDPSSATLSVTRALWQQLLAELRIDDLPGRR